MKTAGLTAILALISAHAWAVVDGFDYPLSPPDGSGYDVCQDFDLCTDGSCQVIPCTDKHLGEDWNRGSQNDDCGDAVYAVADGTVYMPGHYGDCWANVVFIRHPLPDGTVVESMYGHLNAIEPDIAHDQPVVRGQRIGEIGGSGLTCSQFCHLHFEIRLSNCPSWGTPGPGYSPNTTGWADPSQFIDANRTIAPQFRCQLGVQSPQDITVAPGDTINLWANYLNVGTATWNNMEDVTDPNSVELWSCRSDGVIADSWFEPVNWINRQRVKGCDEATVPPDSFATFTFQAQIPSVPSQDTPVYFRPTHGGQLMEDWGNLVWNVHVDADPPTVPSPTVMPDTNAVNSFAFNWTASSDARSGVFGYLWRINGGAEILTTGTSLPLISYPGVVEGSNTFSVRAVDAVGNSSTTGETTFVLDSSGEPTGEALSRSFTVNAVTSTLLTDVLSRPFTVSAVTPTPEGQAVSRAFTVNNVLEPMMITVSRAFTVSSMIPTLPEALSRSFTVEGVPSDSLVTSVLDGRILPTIYRLHQSVPNPFNPATTIRYDLPMSSQVSLRIYNAAGRLVRVLVANIDQEPGQYAVLWRGRDERGVTVASGIYFYALEAGTFRDTRRMVLLR